MKTRFRLWCCLFLGAFLFAGCTLMIPQGSDAIMPEPTEPVLEKKVGDAGANSTPDASEPSPDK